MTDDIIKTTLTERAERALGAAHIASNEARESGSTADRAEHARRARELAAYARELLAIVRESEPMEVDEKTAPALTEDAWFRTTLAQVSTVHGCRVDFAAAAGRSNVDIDDIANGGHVLGVADGGDIVEAFARALAQVPRMKPLLATRTAR